MTSDVAEKAALVYLLFGNVLPDGGQKMVDLMDAADDDPDEGDKDDDDADG